nr:MAG TPA: protein of unknown function (DUF4187) [Caudoviricetes sp.]
MFDIFCLILVVFTAHFYCLYCHYFYLHKKMTTV